MLAEAPAEGSGDCEGRRKLVPDRKVIVRIDRLTGREIPIGTGVALGVRDSAVLHGGLGSVIETQPLTWRPEEA